MQKKKKITLKLVLTLFLDLRKVHKWPPLYLSIGMQWQEAAACYPSLLYVKGGGRDKKNGLFKQWDLRSLPHC